MFITIINDSNDDNAKARQETRYATLFPRTHISYVGIDSSLGIKATIETAGNLIDVLDAAGGEKGVIAVNVAPRGQVEIDGNNGSKFCYFWVRDTLVVSTIKGYNLSLIKKFQLTKHINILETNHVLDFAESKGLITKNLNNHVANTQFRSFDFQPRVAKWLMDGHKLPRKKFAVNELPDIPPSVWFIDSFGNIKTTLTEADLPSITPGVVLRLRPQGVKLNYYNRMKDVPDGETALITGSSGFGKNRFLELITQNRTGESAKNFNLKIGDEITIV